MLLQAIGFGLGWGLMGYIGWAWTNFNAYADDPKADENPKKWDMLPIMVAYGPLAPIITLIIGLVDRNLRFGLRFK